MSFTTTELNPTSRQEALEYMASNELDVLVIGAGVVGAGAALDAATRGLNVGLVEARDLAAGTSSRSSKLVHGGLRYLKQLNFSLVFEALRERSLILDTLCPHLARPVEFIYPLERKGIDRGYVGLGIGVYDVLGAGKGVPSHHKHMSKKKTLESFPDGKKGHIQGAIKFYEGQLDDARHTMMIARTAAAYGAHVATSSRVVGLIREGERVVGATVRDLESGKEIQIRAKQTVNATGVWTDDIQKMIGGKGQFRVQASKGVHIVIPRDRIKSKTGLITETEKSLLFIIPCPWSDDFWVIGTTDTPWDLDLAHPAASRSDIDYILEHANALLEKPLTRDDVVGVYAGLRPLLAGESDQTSKLSREHACVSPVPGLVIVAGGKYTTYRVMAEDAINEAVKGLPGNDREVLHGQGSADRRRRLQAAVEHQGRRWPLAPGWTSRGSSTCSAGTAARSTSCWASPRANPNCCSRSRPRRSISRWRPSTRSPTRVPCTWTTSWPAGPGSPSTPGTAETRRPRRLRNWWRRYSAGMPPRWTGRCRTTGHEWPRNESRSRCRTIKLPTQHGSGRKMSGWGRAEPDVLVPTNNGSHWCNSHRFP